MRATHFLVRLLVTAALIASCVFVFLYPVSELWAILTDNLPDNDLYRQILAAIVGTAIFLSFLPLWPKRGPKERTFAFQGTHGEVTIELEPVEDTLERVLGKLPEVKWVTIRIEPQGASADGIDVFVKGSFRREDSSDIRHTSAWIQSFVKSRTQRMLGVQNVDVKLHLKNQPTNMKSVQPEPLMLEAPRSDYAPAKTPTAAAAPIAAQAPVATPPPIPEPVPADPEPDPHQEPKIESKVADESALRAQLVQSAGLAQQNDDTSGISYQSPAFKPMEETPAEENPEVAPEEDEASGDAPVAWSPENEDEGDRRESRSW